ncbi:MAG TPA: hypothetical protein VJZ51_01210 [Bacilli bacterium]|nr:hypothetical protein [Bacilli bacterium]
MIYILLGYIALSWIASSIVIYIPNRYTKVIISLLVITNPFFLIHMLIELAILKKLKKKGGKENEKSM